jgi:hypothetical protein
LSADAVPLDDPDASPSRLDSLRATASRNASATEDCEGEFFRSFPDPTDEFSLFEESDAMCTCRLGAEY